jgi:Double-GTPase 1
MADQMKSVLILGESNVGKTHYGAQFLKRLIVGSCALRMGEAGATNLQPFEEALKNLAEGRAAEHTATKVYTESVWPVRDMHGLEAELVWPDYGGEQIRLIVAQRRVPRDWEHRIVGASDWVLLLRLHVMKTSKDVFSRPISEMGKPIDDKTEHQLSDQARTVELLQILRHVAGRHEDDRLTRPNLTILLTCWDELHTQALPAEVLREHLPLLFAFVHSNWLSPRIFGLSALERSLSPTATDVEYANRGPEEFGYVISPSGEQSTDITLPIQYVLDADAGA